MNALENHNKMFFKLAKKNSIQRELKDINKIKKASYDSSRSDNSSIFINLDYSKYYILHLRG